MTDITELTAKLKAAAQDEIMCREAFDTSDAWHDAVSPESILALVEALESAQSRIEKLEARALTVEHMDAGLRAHGLKVIAHSQLSDGFRCGYRWAAAGIKLLIEGE